jgi:predicted esterase
MPAMIFLHGSAGNFKAYIWLLSRIAEERGMVVIAPTFGFGNWREPGGVEAIYRALDDACTFVEINPQRVYLAGLSNGGLGVSLAGGDQPERFAGLVFLSPVFATGVTDSPTFLHAWAGHPILIITGLADDRIPVSYVETRVNTFESAGVDVTYHEYPNEDHFLVFSRRDEVLNNILDWLNTND